MGLGLPRVLRYSFHYAENCIMCSSPANRHQVLGKRLNQPQGMSPIRKLGVTTTIVKCRDCGLIFPNPLPVPIDFSDHYGVSPQQYWNEKYFDIDPNYFCGQIATFARLHKQHPIRGQPKALDVGAGIGKGIIALQHAGFDAYGVEPSPEFFSMALDKMRIPPSHLQCVPIEEAQFEEGYFDFISFGAVLEHLVDPSAAIQKAIWMLKADGIMHIEVPSSSWLVSRIANWYYWLLQSDYVANVSPMHKPYHLYEFTPTSFRKHGLRHGYGVAFHRYYVCQTYMPTFLSRSIEWFMQVTSTGMMLEVWLKKSSSGVSNPPHQNV